MFLLNEGQGLIENTPALVAGNGLGRLIDSSVNLEKRSN
jgi:hypothetical protein